MLHHLWNLEIQLIPVILALLLIEIPGIIRRFKKIFYVPIYFSIFPFRELNKDLSKYLADDWFFGEGAHLSQQELDELQKKIIRTSIISMTISVVITPAIAGFASSFFLPTPSFLGLFILFVAYKLIGLVQSAITFGEHAVATKKNLLIYCIIYFVYFGCFITIFEISYDWARPYVEAGDLAGLWKEVRILVFGQIIVLGLIVALVAGVATSLITERRLRQQIRNDHQ